MSVHSLSVQPSLWTSTDTGYKIFWERAFRIDLRTYWRMDGQTLFYRCKEASKNEQYHLMHVHYAYSLVVVTVQTFRLLSYRDARSHLRKREHGEHVCSLLLCALLANWKKKGRGQTNGRTDHIVVVKFSQNAGRKYWASRLSVCSFTCIANSYAFFALLACFAMLTCSILA